MFCNHCGHQNAGEANFCSSCGAVMEPERTDDTTMTFVPVEAAGEVADGDVSVALDLAEGPAMLVVKRGPNAGSKFALDTDLVRAGRHPNSDIFLDDITVSRRHAEVVRDGDTYKVRDAGSLNGTYLNRERIDEAPLTNGDELQVGKFRLVFFSGGSKAEE